MGAEYKEHLPAEMVVAITILVLLGLAIVFRAAYRLGIESGYKKCLDDARLCKPPKYKLVETCRNSKEVGAKDE